MDLTAALGARPGMPYRTMTKLYESPRGGRSVPARMLTLSIRNSDAPYQKLAGTRAGRRTRRHVHAQASEQVGELVGE